MKNRVLYVSLFLVYFSLLPHFSSSQEWVKTYSSNNNSVFTRQLIETYDHGYILGSDMTVGYSGLLKIGWVIKLDVNGNILWNKKLGNGTQMWEIEGINETPDGGLIVTGGADTLNNMWYDSWVTKLSACGEIEWCKIFHSTDGLYCGHSIISLDDNSCLLLLSNWETFPETSTWLMHLDPTGVIIWEQEYFANDTLIKSEEPKNVIISANGNYLITGTCDYPDSGTVSPWWIQPMLIMADSSGQAVWELPWGNAQHCGGEGFQSVVSGNTNSMYTSISRYPHGTGSGYKPALIKTTASGIPGTIKNLKDSTEFGKATTIDNKGDSVLYIGAGYKKNGINYLSIIKTDTIGNIIKEKVLNNKEYFAAILSQT